LEIKRLNAEIIQGIFLYELNGEKTSTAMQLIESFKEPSDGRYQIKGRQKFKESFKILEKRYQQYLEKFENNNIFLKNRRNGEKILRSSKK
jgi:ABC-type transporter MlaC component